MLSEWKYGDLGKSFSFENTELSEGSVKLMTNLLHHNTHMLLTGPPPILTLTPPQCVPECVPVRFPPPTTSLLSAYYLPDLSPFGK